MGPSLKIGSLAVLESQDLQKLFDLLRAKGYRLVGPTVRDNVITYDELTSVKELPVGWTDVQEGATYRLEKVGGGRFLTTGAAPIL